MRKVSVLLITVALIAGMVGCPADPEPTPPAEYSLTISSSEGGEVTTPGEGVFVYSRGETVSLVTAPASGYYFGGWTGDVSTIANTRAASTTITMNGDYSITADFQVIPLAKYNLTVSSTEGGSVTTPGEGTFTYDAGKMVDLVAEPDEGYRFTEWTGSVGAIGDASAVSTTITMNAYCTITANFAKEIRTWHDLDAVRDNLGGSYVLMNDLDSTTAGYAELAGPTANDGKGWQPVGSLIASIPHDMGPVVSARAFTGNLDGRGHEIRDLFINRPNEDGVGLFGCVGAGVIESLGLVNVEVTGHGYVGGLIGYSGYGIISNSYSGGSVAGHVGIGGLVGRNEWNGRVSDSHSACSVAGYQWVGGLVGANSGIVTTAYATGSVTGSGHSVGGLLGANWRTVSNSYSTSIVAGRWGVGGLVGWNHVGTLTNCFSTGSVTGEGGVGGLVGQHRDGTVSNSYYDYDAALINGKKVITIGALFGEDFEQWLDNDKFLDIDQRLAKEDDYYVISSVSDFRELLAFGQNPSLKFRLNSDINLSNHPGLYIPYLAGEFDGDGRRVLGLSLHSDCVVQVGLFGYLASGGVITGVGVEHTSIFANGMVGILVGENDGTVRNCYASGSVAGWWSVGGLVGQIGWSGGSVTNSFYDYEETLINERRRMITIGALTREDFRQWLDNGKFLDVNGRLSKEDGSYLISSIGDLRQLLAFGQDASLRFRLTSDLDLATQPGFYVPYLAGEFDGDGHKISNLRLSTDSAAQVGLFGYLAPGGKVTQVGVENANAVGGQQVGGLVGGSAGDVSNSYCTGTVTGGNHAGGLVGWNTGSVSKSSSSAVVTGEWAVGGLVGWSYLSEGTLSDSYSTGRVSGDTRVGGLVGSNDGGTVTKSYSTSVVTGNSQVGGLVGRNGVHVRSSFWDVQTSGQSTSDGGVGKTTTQMKSGATFSAAGWNIVAVTVGERNTAYTWNIVDGQTYPFLSWQQFP